MRKKNNTIRMLAAFTALTSGATPIYSHAQAKSLPSIELNFDVLERLQIQEEPVLTKNLHAKPAQLEDSERIVKPELKPQQVIIAEPAEKVKHENAQKAAKKDDLTILPSSISPDSEKQPAGVVSKDSTPPIVIEKDVQSGASGANAVQTEKKSALSSFLDKFTPTKPEKTDAVKVEPLPIQEAVTSDAVKDIEQTPVIKESKATATDTNKKARTEKKKETKKKTSSEKSKEASKKPVKKQVVSTSKDVPSKKTDTKTENAITVPEIKHESLARPATTDVEKAPENTTVQQVPEQETVMPEVVKNENHDEIISKPTAEEQAKNNSAWQLFLKESKKKSDAAELSNTETKPAEEPNSFIFASKPSVVATSKNPIEDTKPEAPEVKTAEETPVQSEQFEQTEIETVAPQEENLSEQPDSASETEVAKIDLLPEEMVPPTEKETIDRDVIEEVPSESVAPKAEKGFFASLMDKITSFGSSKKDIKNSDVAAPEETEQPIEQNTDTNEPPLLAQVKDATPENSPLEEEMAKSKKILEEKAKSSTNEAENNTTQLVSETERKLSDAIDSQLASPAPSSVPPVPEPAEIPMQLSALPPPGDAAHITLKDMEKGQEPENQNAPGKQQVVTDNNILLSITFDENNVTLSNSDKEKLNKLIQNLLDSGKRLKVMSYASGVDNEVNSARRISLQRAIAIRTQMIQAGLEKNRINVQAIGNNTTDKEFANSTNIYVVE